MYYLLIDVPVIMDYTPPEDTAIMLVFADRSDIKIICSTTIRKDDFDTYASWKRWLLYQFENMVKDSIKGIRKNMPIMIRTDVPPPADIDWDITAKWRELTGIY